MSIEVAERVDSRPFTDDPKAMSASREYWAHSTDIEEDVSEISGAVGNVAPKTYLGMIRKRIVSAPQGSGFWHVSVAYELLDGTEMAGQGADGEGIDNAGGSGGQGSPDNGEGGGEPGTSSPAPAPIKEDDKLGREMSFTTSGGTQHITQSLNTLEQKARAGRIPPATKNAIGVTKTEVAGVDVVVPKLEFSIGRRVAFVTMRYLLRLIEATGKVNSDQWNAFEPGEVLFLGADGKYDGNGRDDNSWIITFKFAGGKNQVNVAVSDEIVIERKRGWDYLWVGYDEAVDAAGGGITLQKPLFANVEEVYDNTNFRQALGF